MLPLQFVKSHCVNVPVYPVVPTVVLVVFLKQKEQGCALDATVRGEEEKKIVVRLVGTYSLTS